MKVSVIIPTYKPGKYIWKCLDSFKTQSFDKKDYELIIVLNGCCEPYKTQIEEYVKTNLSDNEVVFIHTNVGGVSNARNLGLDIARGEYITFMDDDDFVSPAYLHELYNKALPGTVSVCYPYIFDDRNVDKQLKDSLTDAYEYCLANKKNTLNTKARKYFAGPWMKLIHRDIIGTRRFNVNFKNHEDSIFMFLISDKIKSVAFTSKNAVYYRRIRSNSAMTRHRSYKEIILTTVRSMGEYCKIYFPAMKRYSFHFFCTRMMGSLKGFIVTILSK